MDVLEKEKLKPGKLSDLKPGLKAIVYKIEGSPLFKKRISELGFIYGTEVKVIKKAPLQNPLEYEILGYRISLRKEDAAKIKIVSHKVANLLPKTNPGASITNASRTKASDISSKKINVALIGNPNTGKTTLFNHASGSREKVGNYAGVTIDVSNGKYKYKDFVFNIADLPGIYALTEYSPEELYVRQHLLQSDTDVIINIADASNLERNLYLTMQLADMNYKVVLALNMYDELELKNWTIDCKKLSALLGIPVIPTMADKGKGIEDLFKTVLEQHQGKSNQLQLKSVHYGDEIEKSIGTISQNIDQNPEFKQYHSSRFLSVRFLEGDEELLKQFIKEKTHHEISSILSQELGRLENILPDDPDTFMIQRRYAFIQDTISQCVNKNIHPVSKKWNWDRAFTHPIWGIPIFILFIWLSFEATFNLGAYPMDWIDSGISALSDGLKQILNDGPFKDLLIDGIIGGIGGVIIFLPNILILFCCLSIMEDTGYMARAAFIMDRLMSKIGLHGKAFIPLIMGFGCNVPAMMSTRTIENRRDRLKTLFMIPFMSCSARLPVYILFIGAFFSQHQSSILLAVYSIGILMALGVGIFFNKSTVVINRVPFIMELPPYRIPTLKNTAIHIWQKASQYLRKMGTTILYASIIIWALGYFPQDVNYSKDYTTLISNAENNTALSEQTKADLILELELSKAEEHLEKSYIGQLGHWMSPILYPLGFDWKMGVSIITGMAAKEIVVSSMGVLYHADLEADENSVSLIEKIKNRTYKDGPRAGEKIFSPLIVFSFMIFILIYFPCVAVIAALKKEAGWFRAISTAVFTTMAAWFVSLYIYHVGSFLMG